MTGSGTMQSGTVCALVLLALFAFEAGTGAGPSASGSTVEDPPPKESGDASSVPSIRDRVTFSLPFTVREDVGIARRGEPVSVGLPIPLSACAYDERRFVVADRSGRRVAAQCSVLSRWDGPVRSARFPIRWLRVELAADVGAKELVRYRLAYIGEGPPPVEVMDAAVAVVDEGETLRIDTGAAVFRLSRTGVDLFDSVTLPGDGEDDPDRVVARGMGGLRILPSGRSAPFMSRSTKPRSLRVTHRGKQSVEVMLEARLDSKTHNRAFEGQLPHLELETRYRFFAGSTRASVTMTIRNPERAVALDLHRGGAASRHELRDLSLRLGLPESKAYAVEFGSDLGIRRGFPAASRADRFKIEGEDRITLYQDSSGGAAWTPPKSKPASHLATTFRGYRYLTGAEGDGTPQGGSRSPGHVRLRGEGFDVWTGMRAFWENYPKAIRVSAKGVFEIALFPGEWRAGHEFRGGLAKTHEILFDFDAGPRSDELGAWLRAPLSVFAAPSAYRDSVAAGFLAEYDAKAFSSYEREALAVVRYTGPMPQRQGDLFRERDDRDLYGWMNFGDSYRGGSKESRYFGNNEFDFARCLLWQYLRRPEHEPEFREAADSMIDHLLDIDVYHTDRDLFWANRGIRKHDASGIFDHGNKPHTSHFWIAGIALDYWTTGDSRSLAGLHEISRWLTALEHRRDKDPGDIAYGGEVRSRGWVLHALLDLYEVFGEESWLAFADRVAERMIHRVVSERGFIINSARQVFPWQMGYVTDAIGRYLWIRERRGEDDPESRAVLVKMLDYLRTEAWMPQANAMAYTVDPFAKKVVSAGPNVSRIQSNGFAYGYCLTGRRAYLEMARQTFHSQDTPGYPYYYSTTLGTPAKGAGFRLRFGQVYMGIAQMLRAAGRDPVVRVSDVRRLGTRGPHALLDVNRPQQLSFTYVSPSRDTPSAAAGDAKPAQTWQVKVGFPGPRSEPLRVAPKDPRGIWLEVRGEAGDRESRVSRVALERSNAEVDGKRAKNKPANERR